MHFQLLGPVRVLDETGEYEISGLMPRTILAALLLDAKAVVSTERLTAVLWPDGPPSTAAASLTNHVSRLRRMLGDEAATRIRTASRGYVLGVEPTDLDIEVFTAHCVSGRDAARAGDWLRAKPQLDSALALWRGRPLEDVPALQDDPRVAQLHELRWLALEGRLDADLFLGRHHEIIGELRTLIAQEPLREFLYAQLMTALYRAGRQAEALDAFAELRRTLIDELGVEPAPTLRTLQQRILNADPDLAAPTGPRLDAPAEVHGPDAALPAAHPRPVPGGEPRPRDRRSMLPTDTRLFTGRETEIGRLLEAAGTADAQATVGSPVVCAISGMAGIGKTALAVHVAHRVSTEFPDGRLFLDLHGHTEGFEPTSPEDALGRMLGYLGVSAETIPETLDERSALYRDRLHGTRTLILLDNAVSAAQLRPLLPATPGCLVLVTSRRTLAGLDDACHVALDSLAPEDAAVLVERVVGEDRAPRRHTAMQALVQLCAGVPLAVRIVASRLLHQRALGIEDVIAQLREEDSRLRHLQDEDRSVAAVIDLSYTALPEAEQQLFRLLSIAPGPDIDLLAAGHLIDADPRTAAGLLDALVGHSLLIQHRPDRYRLHDLIRAYGRERSTDEDVAAREKALERLFGHYEQMAAAADWYLSSYTKHLEHPADTQSVRGAPADYATARAWLEAEQENLLSALALATTQDWYTHLIALSTPLSGFLRLGCRWQRATEISETAARAAHARGDVVAEADALFDVGRVWGATGDHGAQADARERALALYRQAEDKLGEANAACEVGRALLAAAGHVHAVPLFEETLELFQKVGDLRGQGNARFELGRAAIMAGDYPRAQDLLRRSLAAYREFGHPALEATALSHLGRVAVGVGDLLYAAELFEQSLVLCRALDHPRGMANALFGLGHMSAMSCDYAAATERVTQALELFVDLGQRHGEADCLTVLGAIILETGESELAVEMQRRALAIYRELDQGANGAMASWLLGKALLASGDTAGALEIQQDTLARFRAMGVRPGEAGCLQELGRVRGALGDADAARALLQDALGLFREIGDLQGETECGNAFAGLLADEGESQRALDLFREVLSTARTVRSPIEEARALEGAARCLDRLGDRSGALAGQRAAVALYRRIGAARATPASERLAALEQEHPGTEPSAGQGGD